MKECSCTIGFRELSWERTLEILERIGLKYIEGSAEIPNCHLNYYLNNPEKLPSLMESLESHNVKVVSVMGMTDFAVSQNLLDDELKKARRQIEFAYRIDAEILRVFASHIPKIYVRDDMYTQIARCLKILARDAENFGVKIAVENHGGVTAKAEQVKRILSEVNEEYVGLNLDPANFAVSEENPVEATKDLLAYVIHVHLKDYVKTEAGYEFREIGAGEIDYRNILRIMKAEGYNGYLSLEYENTLDPERGTREGLINLRKILKEIGALRKK